MVIAQQLKKSNKLVPIQNLLNFCEVVLLIREVELIFEALLICKVVLI